MLAPPMSSVRPTKALSSILAMAFALSFIGASCGQDALSIMPGVVNSPQNRSLRRAILSFATSQICSEMLRRSVPLKLREDDPIGGRFYGTSCFAQEIGEGQSLFIQFSGYGYAWTNLTKRLGFDASGAIEYEQDFLMEGSTMYVYFRKKAISATSFKYRLIERPEAASFGAVAVNGENGSTDSLANAIGAQILKTEVGKGFTVIREDDGAVAFGLGVVPKGQKPAAPYKISESGRLVLVNDRTEVHSAQRDYVGPLEVDGKGKALYITAAVDGAPTADLLLVSKTTGDTWLGQYTTQAALTPLPDYAPLDDTVTQGVMFRRTVALPKGQYYLVVDNSGAAGKSNPPANPNDDRAVLVNFAIELGPAP